MAGVVGTAAASGGGLPLAVLQQDAMDAGAFEGKYGGDFLLLREASQVDGADLSMTVTVASSRPGAFFEDTVSQAGYSVYPVRRTGGARFGADYIGVGRADHNDVAIQHATISKFHAFFKRDEEGFMTLADGGSKNGTFVNDQAVPNHRSGKPVRIRDGDNIRFGDVCLTYMTASSLAALVRRLAG